MSDYCDANRFIPVAPNSLNRAENTWGRIHGGAYLNARRTCISIGALGWSLIERCAVFQHSHTPAPHALGPASRRCTRWEPPTQEVFDVSTILGFPGQSGFTHRTETESSTLTARPHGPGLVPAPLDGPTRAARVQSALVRNYGGARRGFDRRPVRVCPCGRRVGPPQPRGRHAPSTVPRWPSSTSRRASQWMGHWP